MRRRHSRLRPAQLALPFARRGGARPGAGRKPKGPRPLVSHARRPHLSRHHPVHVTTRLARGLPSLRHFAEIGVLVRAIRAARERFALSVVHYSVQGDHLHLLVEAEDARPLSRGMKGLLVRMARALNHLWHRAGRVFADRIHARALRTPREVRNALVYVLNNSRKHVGRYRGTDPGSSGRWFDGWSTATPVAVELPPVSAARTWLMSIGWRRHGRIDPSERPGAGP